MTEILILAFVIAVVVTAAIATAKLVAADGAGLPEVLERLRRAERRAPRRI
ncbi:hypothetical protein [Agromyces sp. LHK192]|uniref:hypothetical protein n=1 Tax=Agromyces sp. LHK192 TaxID=2498704 RepID=UPI0013E33D7D|nr:hypothetical protein [Agromyces sp. LHK192]